MEWWEFVARFGRAVKDINDGSETVAPLFSAMSLALQSPIRVDSRLPRRLVPP